MIEDLNLNDMLPQHESPEERQCVDCQELFLSLTPDLLCPKCARKAITGEED